MKVLIIGGSEFVGKQLANTLLSENNIEVFIINRGKKYWNELMRNQPKINHYYGDRNEYLEFEKLINYISEKHQINKTNKWDLVVDFSAFERKQVKSVIRSLKNLCKLYVFISSDSIYDVCD